LRPRGKARLRPRRSHPSSLVWSCVTTQFAKTLGGGWFEPRCARLWVRAVSTRRHRYATALCSRTRSHVALTILDASSGFSRAFMQLDSPLTVGVGGGCYIGVVLPIMSIRHGCAAAHWPRSRTMGLSPISGGSCRLTGAFRQLDCPALFTVDAEAATCGLSSTRHFVTAAARHSLATLRTALARTRGSRSTWFIARHRQCYGICSTVSMGRWSANEKFYTIGVMELKGPMCRDIRAVSFKLVN
jgi:hypothetical protein